MSCKQSIIESWIARRLTCPPGQNHIDYVTAPEDAMQIDSVSELPRSGGYESIVTAKDVFSLYFFAYPTSNQAAEPIA